MLTRKASPEESEASVDTQPQNLDTLFAEVAKMNTTLLGVATDVTIIKETTTELKTTVTGEIGGSRNTHCLPGRGFRTATL